MGLRHNISPFKKNNLTISSFQRRHGGSGWMPSAGGMHTPSLTWSTGGRYFKPLSDMSESQTTSSSSFFSTQILCQHCSKQSFPFCSAFLPGSLDTCGSPALLATPRRGRQHEKWAEEESSVKARNAVLCLYPHLWPLWRCNPWHLVPPAPVFLGRRDFRRPPSDAGEPLNGQQQEEGRFTEAWKSHFLKGKAACEWCTRPLTLFSLFHASKRWKLQESETFLLNLIISISSEESHRSYLDPQGRTDLLTELKHIFRTFS